MWTLFYVNKGIPQMVSGIIQYRALTLATYSYTFIYVPDTKIPHVIHEIPPIQEVIFCINNIEEKISIKEIRKEIALDQVL